MAISVTNGAFNKSAVSSAAASTLVLPTTTATLHADIVVHVALAIPTPNTPVARVTGITDTAGNTFISRVLWDGAGVRTEIWEAQDILSSASDVVTISFTVPVVAAAALMFYSGVVKQSLLSTNQLFTSAAGLGALVGSGNMIQEQGNWVTAALGFLWSPGMTYAVEAGAFRIAAIPTAAGAPAIVSLDLIGVPYQPAPPLMAVNNMWIRLSATGQWASDSLELRSGGPAIGASPVDPVDPAAPTVPWSITYTQGAPTYGLPTKATVDCRFQGAGCGSAGEPQGNTGH